MTKKKIFLRIIICALLVLIMLWGACSFLMHIYKDYDIFVAGKLVTNRNADDILGDGTVYYDIHNNFLVLNNATIESENWPVYSKVDLNVELIGENKLICKNKEYSGGIYAGDYHLAKDLAIIGDGSLTIEIPDECEEVIGLFASDLLIASDINVITPNCEDKVNGILCDSSLLVLNKATVSVNNGAANNSVGARVRGNALFEEGTALKVSVNPGTTEICRGLSVSGDIVLGKDTSLEVSVDDGATDRGECIRVSGLMEVGIGSNVTASSKNAYAIECFGAIEAKKDSTIFAVSDKKDSDILCGGALINYGAEIDAKIDALGGIHNK